MSRVRAGVIALMALVGGCSAGATPELNTVGTDGVIPTVATLGPNQGAPSSVDSTSKPAVTTTVLGRTAASEPGGAPSSKPLAARTIDARPEGQVVTLGLAPSVARALRELRELVVGFDAVLPFLPIPKLNIYAETGAGNLSPKVRDIASRVYVPNSDAGTVTVIDPATMQVVATYRVGGQPHHIVPSWNLSTLYVLDTTGNRLIPIDPRVGAPGTPIPVTDPYNLYFRPDGREAIVVAERLQRLDIRDPQSWELLASISVPHAGVNHGDFSPDGRYFTVSCEFSGWVAIIDLDTRKIVRERRVGSEPIDVRFSPDASTLYIADQARGGVIVADPNTLDELGFLPTGAGAHGLYPSRDGSKLYVSNRLASSVSVIDFATRQIAATWRIPGGGSPDMGGVSTDGSQLWLAGRYHGAVYVFDTATGGLIAKLGAGAGAHGLSIFPQPGRYSMGHTGNYR